MYSRRLFVAVVAASLTTATAFAAQPVCPMVQGPAGAPFPDCALGQAPHIFGDTRYDTEFGSGYAAAEDRLFFMDVLRHVGRSQVSAFLGPSDSSLALDCMIARVAGYNEAELQQQAIQTAAEFPAPFDA